MKRLKRILGNAFFVAFFCSSVFYGAYRVLHELVVPPIVHAQQPQYGGIISQQPFLQGQVMAIELTWLGFRVAATTNVLVKYQYICDNGSGAVSAGSLKQGSFIASDGQAGSAAFGFSGTGTPFPCNGWLINASWLISAPNSIGPGELSAQLQIQDALAISWNPALPAANGANLTVTNQAILTGIIESVLCSGEATSGYAVSWPSCQPYWTHPRMGSGAAENIPIANPAAGANWSCGATSGVAGCSVISNNNQVQLINITETVTTSATAGNTYACIYLRTGGVAGTVVATACSSLAQQPLQTVTYSFQQSAANSGNCSFIGGTQTAVKCPYVAVTLPFGFEANGNIDNFAITSFLSSEVSTTTATADAAFTITNINIRARAWHGND